MSEFNDISVHWLHACSIRLVCIDMHQGQIFLIRLYSDLTVSEDKRSVFSIQSDSYCVACIEAPLLLLLKSDMYMSLGDDDAFFEAKFSGRSDELDARGPFKVSGESDRCVYAKRSCVGLGKFHL